MENNDIIYLLYHILDTKHLICQVSLKSNKAKLSKYTFSAVRTALMPHTFNVILRRCPLLAEVPMSTF